MISEGNKINSCKSGFSRTTEDAQKDLIFLILFISIFIQVKIRFNKCTIPSINVQIP